MSSRTTRSRRNRKIAAIAAGTLVLGLAATYTLATWTDSEWVWGGSGSSGGIGTSKFEVEQSVDNVVTWQNDEVSPGGSLAFSANALQLTPGDTTYASVSLRTQTASIGGNVTLQGAVPNPAATGTSTLLWEAVRVSAYTSSAATAPNCDAASLGSWTAVPAVQGVVLSTAATASQALEAATSSAPGAPQHYCLALTLPTGSPDTLQGTTIAPVWKFESVSVTP